MKTLNIKAIRIDGGTQSRVEINSDAVAEYADALTAGAGFPPVITFFDGVDHWLADGFHRFHAFNKIGIVSIDADVREGTQRDAMLFSFGANGTHGQRRTNADKRKAVASMLADSEWSKWSDNQIAKTAGVHHSTVAEHRKSLAESASEKPQERTYTNKHGTQSVMKTEGIGKAQPAEQLAPAPAPEPEDDGAPDAAELESFRAQEEAAAKTLQFMLASDDVAADLAARNTQLEAQIKLLELRIAGLQNSNTEYIRTIKSLQNKIKKQEASA